tara:strand:+ start:547 stop:987 length:441 start_codon:yes stop_codon:yes gene_type:complete
MKLIKTLALLVALSSCAFSQTYTWRQTLDAIRQVETGGEPNEGVGARGDRGNAIGPYQIWRVYHFDAAERDTGLTSYANCLNDKAYSERVMRSYMNRYNRASLRRLEQGKGSLEDVIRTARIHNGGPKGYRKQATLKYAKKVEAAL